MNSQNEELLEIKKLKTHFFTSRGVVKAVDGVSLKVGREKAIVVAGESGCGKTVTSLSIMRLVPVPGRIVDGQILFNGKNLTELTEGEMRKIRGKSISMVFQDPVTYLNPVMKIGDQIAETILKHQNLSKNEAKTRVVEALSEVGIPSPHKVARYYPHQMSGGMRQRTLIAMAISCNPTLLIADEPTTALDVTIQAQILELIKHVVQKLGMSLLLITHDLGVAAEIADEMYIMYAGQVMESADVFALYERPKHPYTIGLLQSVLSVDRRVETFATIEGTVPDPVNLPAGCRFYPRCPTSKPICRERIPRLVEVEPGHMVSCWLYS